MYTDAEYINIFTDFFEEHLPRLSEKERRRLATSLVGLCKDEGLISENDDETFDLGSEEDVY